jgi:hypothetical protein
MGLPVYEAIGFQQILEKGGHSKPWIVLINMKDSLKPYVVKLYKTIDIEARNKMTAEVMGNILAGEFGLKAPAAAIIDFTPQFRMHLNDACEEVLTHVDERPKFGCEFLEGSYLFSPQTDRKTTNDLLNPALLYAFDYFICNRDRTINKSNLLVKQNETYLIDHEMGLEITAQSISDFTEGIWDSRYQNHLFYKFLKNTRGDKSNLFDEFLLYLQEFNFQRLMPYFTQLEELGFTTHKELILEYCYMIQKKSAIFASILSTSIQ